MTDPSQALATGPQPLTVFSRNDVLALAESKVYEPFVPSVVVVDRQPDERGAPCVKSDPSPGW